MNIKKNVLQTAVIFAALLFAREAVLADADNQLKDASFELQADRSAWILFEESLLSQDQAHSGNQSMFNGGFSRTVSYHPYFVGNVSGSYQELPARPGSRWQLTGYGLTTSTLQGTPAFGIVQLSFFDTDGNDLGTVETANSTTRAKISNEVNNQTAAGEWIFLDTGVATAPEDTATVQAFTIYVDYSGSNISQGVYFDDLTLCAVDDNDSSRCAGD